MKKDLGNLINLLASSKLIPITGVGYLLIPATPPKQKRKRRWFKRPANIKK